MPSRTEDWTKDFGGMTSTAVIHVDSTERVQIRDEIMPELGLLPEDGTADVNSGRQQLVYQFPYTLVATKLRERDWSLVPTDG